MLSYALFCLVFSSPGLGTFSSCRWGGQLCDSEALHREICRRGGPTRAGSSSSSTAAKRYLGNPALVVGTARGRAGDGWRKDLGHDQAEECDCPGFACLGGGIFASGCEQSLVGEAESLEIRDTASEAAVAQKQDLAVNEQSGGTLATKEQHLGWPRRPAISDTLLAIVLGPAIGLLVWTLKCFAAEHCRGLAAEVAGAA